VPPGLDVPGHHSYHNAPQEIIHYYSFSTAEIRKEVKNVMLKKMKTVKLKIPSFV